MQTFAYALSQSSTHSDKFFNCTSMWQEYSWTWILPFCPSMAHFVNFLRNLFLYENKIDFCLFLTFNVNRFSNTFYQIGDLCDSLTFKKLHSPYRKLKRTYTSKIHFRLCSGLVPVKLCMISLAWIITTLYWRIPSMGKQVISLVVCI